MTEQKNEAPQLESLLKIILERDRQKNPARVDPYQETELQRSKRIRSYLQSGATPLCMQCDNMLLLCQCTDLAHGEQINFGWPESYTKEEKKANLLRWVHNFHNEMPKNKINASIYDLQLMADDYLKKHIIDVLGKRKEDLEAMMTHHIRVNNNDAFIKNYGNDAVMFLTDLNILCARQEHWIVMNNAFQN
eukprot:UN09483